ncbi:CpsD/CapB family tyrosine-protein kinase [Yoonia sp. R2331]|uniref:CpsD/CapB family tyrosine-protein kinase n=1 Tax=Yoonia sp. R2331 TaxID=3237238 RepID=UPI0034E4179F
MEKLQKAIAEARKSRAGASTGKTAGAPGRGKPQGATSERGETLWDDIKQMNPDARHMTRNRIVSHKADTASSSFDVLRTKVMQQMQQNGWKRLMITSPMPGCGKTTLAANLAYGVSRQGAKSAILMEFDLRKPNLSNILGVKPNHDIRDVLTGQVSFQDQALRIGQNVAVSMASRRSADPTRYLTSDETQHQLRAIEEAYDPDMMIFDMPPLLVNDDARSFLPYTDCVLLVARAESSTSKQIDVCEKEVAEQTNVVGVVLNHCRFVDETQGYGYGGY